MEINKRRIIALLFAAIIPLAAVAIGIWLAFNIEIWNQSMTITFVVIPAVTLILLTCVILSKMGALLKTVGTICWLLIFLLVFSIAFLFCTYEEMTVYTDGEIGDPYSEVLKEFESMPSLDEVGDFKKAEHYHYNQKAAIFEWNTDTLILQYSSEEYIKQVAKLNERYEFQSENMHAHDYEVEPVVYMDGYIFRFVSFNRENNPDGLYYPDRMILIATNDSTFEIAYMSYYDVDLDYIESIEKFILDDLGWEHIK